MRPDTSPHYMEDKMISIIVPVYNAEKYLDACVESIIRQTYTNWELILVDDGSKDSSPEMCDKWSKADPRIRVIHKTNGGASAARNAGLEIARGEYIGFVDADDLISEQMYRMMIDALQKSGKKMSSCACTIMTLDGQVKSSMGESGEKNLDVKQGLEAILRGELGISMCCKVFKRSIFASIRFPEGETYEELAMMIPLLIESCGIYHTGVSLYYYRKHDDSVTGLNWKRCAGISLKRMEEFRNQIIANDMMKDFNCEFSVYEAKSAYDMAILMDKHYDEVDEKGRMYLKKYVRIMRLW